MSVLKKFELSEYIDDPSLKIELKLYYMSTFKIVLAHND
jgi:hypothetical protein